jgi:anti-anti-sigma regulatory factor
MLRITPVSTNEPATLLRVEGKITGPWVSELRDACHSTLADHGGLKLDCSAVSYIDLSGLQLLRDLQRRGTTLVRCSNLVSELLRSEAP